MLALLHIWANVENRFATLLHNVIKDSSGEIAFAIFFAPSSMEIRFKIGDSALKASLEGQDHSDFLCLWARLYNSIQQSKDIRNAVAHGAIGSYSSNNRNHIRLLPPIFDFGRLLPKIRKRQLPGYSSNDIRQSKEKMKRMLKMLDLVSAWVIANQAGDVSTSQEKLAALKDHLPTATPQPSGQSQPECTNQPEEYSQSRGGGLRDEALGSRLRLTM
jgi:hypothetical protein